MPFETEKILDAELDAAICQVSANQKRLPALLDEKSITQELLLQMREKSKRTQEKGKGSLLFIEEDEKAAIDLLRQHGAR